MDYSYQRLGINDTELLKQLRQVFRVAFDEDDTWNTNPPPDPYLSEVLADKNYIALVATYDNEVVGGLVAHVLPKIDQAHSELYLYDLAVASAHRRKGVATKLIENLKGVGRIVGAYVIFVQADNVDIGAVALYEKLSDSKETDISHFDIRID